MKDILVFMMLVINLQSSIVSYEDLPIYTSNSNAKEFSEYIFFVQINQDVPANSIINIEFPKQYQENLGIYLWAECNLECVILDYKFDFKVPFEVKSGDHLDIKIKNVKNPKKIG